VSIVEPKPNCLISEEMSYIKIHFARTCSSVKLIAGLNHQPGPGPAPRLGAAHHRNEGGAVITKCQ